MTKKYNFDYVIKGAYGTGNFGDDALFDVIHRALPKNASIAVIAKNASYLEKTYNNVIVFLPTDNVHIHCDTLLYGGGTQFYSFSKTSSTWHKIKYHLMHPTYIPNKLLNRLLKISFNKKVGLGLGLGPFCDYSSKNF
jgi:hypothetical protein